MDIQTAFTYGNELLIVQEIDRIGCKVTALDAKSCRQGFPDCVPSMPMPQCRAVPCDGMPDQDPPRSHPDASRRSTLVRQDSLLF